MKYKKRRILVKACIWQFMSFIALGSIIYFITRRWEVVTPVVILYHAAKIAGYYLYDRYWHGVKWGIIDD